MKEKENNGIPVLEGPKIQEESNRHEARHETPTFGKIFLILGLTGLVTVAFWVGLCLLIGLK